MTTTKFVEFRLPDLGEGMEEAQVIEWNFREGDEIALDQPFVGLETDKAVVEIPSPVTGRLVKHHYAVGDVAQVGSVLATFEISVAGSAAEVLAVEPAHTEQPVTGHHALQPLADHEQRTSSINSRPKASPAVRRLAQELNIDLTTLKGTGPGGRIVAEDVRSTQAAPDTAPAAPEPTPLYKAGQTIGDRHITLSGASLRTAEVMAESWSNVAHTWSLDEIDATYLLEALKTLRSRQKEGEPPITMMAFFMMAVAQSLRDHPMQNASLDMAAKKLTLHGRVNIRFAVASPTGLRVPVIKDVDRFSLRSIAAEMDRLTKAARAGTLDRSDTQDGTFTITNYGALGSRFALPLIRPPEVGIIGFGEIKLRPWVVEEQVVARPILPITTCIDHRVLGGDESIAGGLPTGGFRNSVMDRLASPLNLLGGN